MIFSVAVYRHESIRNERTRGALHAGFTIIGLYILLLAFAALSVAWFFHERNPHDWFNDVMPQLQDDFTTAQPLLDSLRGEFGQRSAIAWPCDTHGWGLSYQIAPPSFGIGSGGERIRVNFEDWDSLEWLCQEAADAIVHLTSPQKMNHPFESISTLVRHGDEMHHIYARIEFYRHESEMMIFYSPGYAEDARFVVYHEYLSSGYELILLRRMIYPSVVRIFLVIGAVLLAFALLLLALGRTYRRQKNDRQEDISPMS